PCVDAAVEASSETPIQQFERVASPVHTIFLLVLLAVVAALGYFSVHRLGQVHQPRRLLFFLMAMAWEWLLVGYIYWGLRRRGKSFRNITGKSWQNASDFFLDIAIAFSFWIAAIFVLGIVSRLIHATGMAEGARRLAPQGLFESILWIALSVTAG